jgi:hypothetical protein
LNHLQTSPPTGPESRQQNPQQPVAALEPQATRRVLLENRQLVTQRQDLRLQADATPKTGGYQSKKRDEKRSHRGSHHDLTNDWNLCVFKSDGVFGNDRRDELDDDTVCRRERSDRPRTPIRIVSEQEDN